MNKVTTILVLFAFLLFGCGTSKDVKKNKTASTTKKDSSKTKKENRKPLEKIPGQALKHEFDTRTVYIIIADAPNRPSKKLLHVVARKGDKCLVLPRVVKWEKNTIYFPAGMKWRATKVSENEIDFEFPPQSASGQSKIVRYKKTSENALKGCELKSDPRNFMEGEEKTI